MIIYRAFAGETVRNTIAITLVLALVMGFLGITALLGRAVRGDLAEDIVLQMFSLQTLRRLDLLLTLGLYLGVLMTAARWYRDSEMTVLAACGIGLTQLLRPMILLTAVMAIMISALGFYFTPWAAARMERIKAEREQQRQPVSIAPGVFNESSGGRRIFYAERVDRATGALGNVFVSGLEPDKESVMVAQSGYPYIDPKTGDRFLVLHEGNLYEGSPGEAGYRLLRFKSLHIRVEPTRVDAPPLRTESMPTLELFDLNTVSAHTEQQWRISKPITAMVLVLFALVLAHTDPRHGRLSNLFAAILVYFIYSNLLVLGQTMMKKQRIPIDIGLWWVHGTMLVVALHLFRQRAMNRPLLAFPRWGQKK